MKTSSKATPYLTVTYTVVCSNTQELTPTLTDYPKQVTDSAVHVRYRESLLSLYVILYREFCVLLLLELWHIFEFFSYTYTFTTN
jgi:hypothetical protein